jgi:protein associated with RNAse G/E
MRIAVEAYRWDGRLKYRWSGELLHANQQEIVVRGEFSREFKTPYHHFQAGDVTREIYPRDAWYNICEIYGQEDIIQGIYCNLAAPPELNGKVLTYIDLALDLYVSKQGDVTVLDEEEFEHLAANQLPADLLTQAWESWGELMDALKRQVGYFKMLAD